jgi:6-phosphogluconolactonase
MDEIEWWEFDSLAELAEQVAGDIGFIIESAVAAHGGARVALPGAEAPDAVYDALLANQAIDWSKVTLIPTDERLVGLDWPLSNYGRLKGLFGSEGAKLVSLVDDGAAGDYQEAGRLADVTLGKLEWPLDLVWLGVGADGHTASIFPGPDLDRAVAGPKERRAVGVRPDPMPKEAAVERVTLTSAALSSARAVMIVIEGDEKRRIVEQAIKEGPLSRLPIGRVLAEIHAAIDIFWTA